MPSSHDQDDERVDEAGRESFPASDPPANTVETGVRVGPLATGDQFVVEHDAEARQFIIRTDGHVAFLQYAIAPDATTILHTDVPKSLSGRGFGPMLAKAAMIWARAQSRPVIVICPFVRAYLKKHPEL